MYEEHSFYVDNMMHMASKFEIMRNRSGKTLTKHVKELTALDSSIIRRNTKNGTMDIIDEVMDDIIQRNI
jgi:acetyl-CoA carboxylase alpha subunit